MWILTDWALTYRNTDSKLCAKNGLYSQANLTKRNDSGLNATEELTKTMQLNAKWWEVCVCRQYSSVLKIDRRI